MELLPAFRLTRVRGRQRWLKRSLDAAVAAFALLFLLPVLAAVAALVRLRMGRPVLFRQRRTGFRGREFVLYKFRTMVERRDPAGRLLADEQRLTGLGRFLRNTSLDETPELWNVVRGDMNLVGPRPLLPEYVRRYNDSQRRRLEVKPGITGWAQVNGRNALTWEERFELDVWYVDHWSLWLDLKILWMTFVRVLRRDGISCVGHATMPEFLGSAEESKSA